MHGMQRKAFVDEGNDVFQKALKLDAEHAPSLRNYANLLSLLGMYVYKHDYVHACFCI